MKTSESINDLATALAKAQGVMHNPARNKANPAFKGSKYADLAAILEAVRTPLSSAGLSYVQTVVPSDKQEIGICTRLMHASGQWIEETYFVPVAKNDAQGFGSAITYARRYSLAALCGVAADDDDDGNAASAKTPPADPIAMRPEAVADLKAQLDEVSTIEELRAKTATALQCAQQDPDAYKQLRDYSIARAEILKRAA